jgi:hypothetical protein
MARLRVEKIEADRARLGAFGANETIAVQLARFDRYERRALSRRKWATRNFDEGVSDELNYSLMRSASQSSHRRVNRLKGTPEDCCGVHGE